jgi:hypothetical protein
MRLCFDAQIAPHSETRLQAVRNACDIVDSRGTWRESLAPRSFVRQGAGAPIQIDHDGQVVGEVEFVIDHGAWHIAQCVVEGTEEELERVRVGQAVSIDARSLDFDEDELVGTRRHFLVRLNHLAILRDRDIPGYANAKITSVRKLAAPPSVETPAPQAETVDARINQLLDQGWLMEDAIDQIRREQGLPPIRRSQRRAA